MWAKCFSETKNVKRTTHTQLSTIKNSVRAHTHARTHLEAVEFALHRAHIDDELPRVRVALHQRFETRIDNGRRHRVDRKHLFRKTEFGMGDKEAE